MNTTKLWYNIVDAYDSCFIFVRWEFSCDISQYLQAIADVIIIIIIIVVVIIIIIITCNLGTCVKFK
jgi:hypothetical protein